MDGSQGGTVVRRLAGFVLLPLLSLAMPFLLMPIVGRLVGTEGYASSLSGQAIGTISSVVVLWGWNVDGTVQVAQAGTADERAELYARSVRTRLLLALAVLPVTALVCALHARHGYAAAEVAMGLAYALLGLSPAWFCIGVGRPGLLGLYDTIPRFLSTMIAAPLLVASGSLWPFPALMALGTAASLTLFHRRFARGRRWWPDGRRTVGELAAQRHTAGINLVGQAYAQTPAPIATATASAPEAAALASTDTLYRLGLFSAAAMGNAFQGWTLEPGAADPRRRHRAALVAHTVLGVAGIVVLVVAGPPVSSVVSGGAARATVPLCLLYGLAFCFLSVATPLTRNLLIPAGR